MSDQRTQEDRILWLLQAAYPGWVAAPELSRISLQYGRVIHSLRHGRGRQIENRVRNVNGIKCGEFRLSTPGTMPNPVHHAERASSDIPTSLFDLGPTERHRDDG